MGPEALMFTPTIVAQNERWSNGSRYPVNDIAIVRISRTTPMIQFSSRGYLYAPKKKVLPMCRNTRITITDEPHLCMPCTNWPRKTSLLMCWIDEYASIADGR